MLEATSASANEPTRNSLRSAWQCIVFSPSALGFQIKLPTTASRSPPRWPIVSKWHDHRNCPYVPVWNDVRAYGEPIRLASQSTCPSDPTEISRRQPTLTGE